MRVGEGVVVVVWCGGKFRLFCVGYGWFWVCDGLVGDGGESQEEEEGKGNGVVVAEVFETRGKLVAVVIASAAAMGKVQAQFLASFYGIFVYCPRTRGPGRREDNSWEGRQGSFSVLGLP